MPITCVCVAVNGANKQGFMRKSDNNISYVDEGKNEKSDLDLCKVWKRTQNKENKHNDYDCHLKGEKRQNIINKLKMFLDDIDDRPVMVAKTGSKTGSKADSKEAGSTKTGYGPLIKYPGYVDYDHPYFSEPFNRLPELAKTTGYQQGTNPCPPTSVTVPLTNFQRSQRGVTPSDNSIGMTCHCGTQREGSTKEEHAGQRDCCNVTYPVAQIPAKNSTTQVEHVQYICYPIPD